MSLRCSSQILDAKRSLLPYFLSVKICVDVWVCVFACVSVCVCVSAIFFLDLKMKWFHRIFIVKYRHNFCFDLRFICLKNHLTIFQIFQIFLTWSLLIMLFQLLMFLLLLLLLLLLVFWLLCCCGCNCLCCCWLI